MLEGRYEGDGKPTQLPGTQVRIVAEQMWCQS